jgi:hypothetical protein
MTSGTIFSDKFTRVGNYAFDVDKLCFVARQNVGLFDTEPAIWLAFDGNDITVYQHEPEYETLVRMFFGEQDEGYYLRE